MAEKPENFFDFTSQISIPPGWAPFGWIKASYSMWAQAIARLVKDKWTYSPYVYSTVILPGWLVKRWKDESVVELKRRGKGEWVSSNDLISAWYVKVSLR